LTSNPAVTWRSLREPPAQADDTVHASEGEPPDLFRGPSTSPVCLYVGWVILFGLMVGHLGWTLGEWREWLFGVLSGELFGSDSGGRRGA
jgi:hypothetical protein